MVVISCSDDIQRRDHKGDHVCNNDGNDDCYYGDYGMMIVM